MSYKLNIDDKEWVKRAIEADKTKLEIIRKLETSDFDDNKILAFVEYYEKIKEKVEPKEEIRDKKDEGKTEGMVRKYLSDKKSEMSWKEKRIAKKFLKNCMKFSEAIKLSIKGFKKELDYIYDQNWGNDKVDKELELLRHEISERILESKGLLDIEHPISKEELTKENIKDLNVDQLLKLMEENVDELDMWVNGKIE